LVHSTRRDLYILVDYRLFNRAVRDDSKGNINATLQHWSLADMPMYYFLNSKDPHILDFFMQGLWNETQYNPLGQRFYSSVPSLVGEGEGHAVFIRTENRAGD